MQCPIDGTALVMTERSGVEIDYCPKCRGVWLDRGELDKIIERSEGQAQARTERRPEPRRDDDDDRSHSRPYRKKREGILGDLFDF